MKNGLLYRKHQETKTGRSSNKLVVPKGLRQLVMSVNHKSAFSGHLGAKKTEVRILLNFFWSGLRQDVIRFCRSCDVCQRTVKKGNQYSLTLVYHATRYPEAVPLKKITTEAVAKALLNIYSRVGIPEEVYVRMHAGSIQTHQYTIPPHL